MGETSETIDPSETLALFFIIGPLRTGSSLMARCIDDHEDAICLCESEITRTLLPEYYLQLHVQRMVNHGFSGAQIISLLDRKAQNSIDSLLQWYLQAAPMAQTIYQKPHARVMGDKSPDIYKSSALVAFLAENFPLIYTTRDPRAIMRSIHVQTDANEQQKETRWSEFLGNIKAWEPHLDKPSILISRYEDLVRAPEATMAPVYQLLNLKPSRRFMEPFQRRHPQRFLWTTAVDWESGVRKDFDPARAEVSDADLTDAQRAQIYDDPDVVRFMERMSYGG